MSRLILTDKVLEKLNPPDGGRLEVFDALLPGFGVRISKSGGRTFFLFYRYDGKQRRATLGKYPVMKLADARAAARPLIEIAKAGGDPSAIIEAEAASPAERSEPASITFKQLKEDFILRYAKPRNRAWHEVERIFDKYVVPQWGHRPAAEIKRQDIIKLLDELVDRGVPVMAKQTHAAIRRLFNWAADRDMVDGSPCVRIPVPGHAIERDRILTEAEIRAVWNAAGQLTAPFGACIKLMLLTGQRRSEVAGAAWSHLDLKKALWTLPREATKIDRAHEVPLSAAALSILRKVPKHWDLAFSIRGAVPIAGFSLIKADLDRLSGVTDWRLHDLRRTAASGMAKLGVLPHVVEKILNHQSGVIRGVAAIYNRHGYLEEKREALEQWGREVSRIASDAGADSKQAEKAA